MPSRNVTVRLDERELDRIQGVASVYGTSLNALMRDAVSTYVDGLQKRQDYLAKLEEAQKRQNELFELLKAAAEQRDPDTA